MLITSPRKLFEFELAPRYLPGCAHADLQRVGFGASVDQPTNLLHGLVRLMSSIPVVIGLLAGALIFFYPLNEAKVSRMASDLKQGRLRSSRRPIAAEFELGSPLRARLHLTLGLDRFFP